MFDYGCPSGGGPLWLGVMVCGCPQLPAACPTRATKQHDAEL